MFGICVSLGIVFEKTRVGLDQDLGVPEDSYVKTFFEFEEEYLLVGAPVYFVIAGKVDYKKVKFNVCLTHRKSNIHRAYFSIFQGHTLSLIFDLFFFITTRKFKTRFAVL